MKQLELPKETGGGAIETGLAQLPEKESAHDYALSFGGLRLVGRRLLALQRESDPEG